MLKLFYSQHTTHTTHTQQGEGEGRRTATAVEAALAGRLLHFLGLIGDEDLHVRKAGVLALSSVSCSLHIPFCAICGRVCACVCVCAPGVPPPPAPGGPPPALTLTLPPWHTLTHTHTPHTLHSATHNQVSHHRQRLVAPHLPSLLPLLYKQTEVVPELIRTVDLGPFKHKVGAWLHSPCFTCFHTLVFALGGFDRHTLPTASLYVCCVRAVGRLSPVIPLLNLCANQPFR